MLKMSKMLIVKDTREKAGWVYLPSECCKGMITYKLNTGDYSIHELTDKLCIERKAAVSELAHNLIEKRFVDVLKRMSVFLHKFIICEFTVDDIFKYPIGSEIPRCKWNKIRINGKFILKELSKIQVEHDIHVIFAGDKDNASKIAWDIMREVYGRYRTA